ncbi:QueT transporter family protein [Leuconostoc gelidum]|uniref:QueT transporter family protein n=1 Tax=Leuconostoc gelidum TaxID=1244 RepID=UPI001C7DD4F0|nr:QueT transporter family protein [Leuconostoc gelidum]MBZ6010882.1 QueT transporter family protein [Leuconostoc gelidum subsp. aenigmaticum]
MQKNLVKTDKSIGSVQNITLIAVIAAVYATITFVIQPFAFGPVQLRASEGLNHLAAWHKRYIIALGLGVFIANLVSPLGWIDWIFGTMGTVIMTSITYLATRRVKHAVTKIVISSVVVATIGMAILAAEFTLAFNIGASGAFPSGSNGGLFAQWLAYYLSVMPGEVASLIAGGIVIYALSKMVDLSK